MDPVLEEIYTEILVYNNFIRKYKLNTRKVLFINLVNKNHNNYNLTYILWTTQ